MPVFPHGKEHSDDCHEQKSQAEMPFLRQCGYVPTSGSGINFPVKNQTNPYPAVRKTAKWLSDAKRLTAIFIVSPFFPLYSHSTPAR